jgi:hypothetical protein
MSYTNPITCENAWLSFEDILRLLYKNGYLGTYGDVGATGESIELQDAFELWRISIDSGGDFNIDNWDGSQWVNVYEV